MRLRLMLYDKDKSREDQYQPLPSIVSLQLRCSRHDIIAKKNQILKYATKAL